MYGFSKKTTVCRLIVLDLRREMEVGNNGIEPPGDKYIGEGTEKYASTLVSYS